MTIHWKAVGQYFYCGAVYFCNFIQFVILKIINLGLGNVGCERVKHFHLRTNEITKLTDPLL